MSLRSLFRRYRTPLTSYDGHIIYYNWWNKQPVDEIWFSTFLQTPDGKEQRDVRINRIETAKAGGEWSEDIEEASNITCYGDNIHPNLVGATPGKSQSNNSGSDKRELFTMKQALEKAWHDIMMTPYTLALRYNGWYGEVRPEVPMLMLTTLDQHTDAKEVKP